MKTLSKLLSFKKLNWVDRIFIAGLLLFTLSLASFRPVPILPEKDCKVLSGVVTDVFEGGTKDINFRLRGHEQVFYVNRGTERGLDIGKLQKELTGKQITIKYPEHWSLLNFNNQIVHISKLESNGQVLFTELNQ